MYIVVFKDTASGVITYSSFRNKKHFDKWYNKRMKRICQVVEKSISQKQAIELCSTPEANKAAMVSQLKEMSELLLLH